MAGSARESRTSAYDASAKGRSGSTEGYPHVGVLALQGAFREHVLILRKLGAQVTEVRLPRDLEGLDGLMIPGGESTTIGLLLEEYKLMEPLRAFVKKHPVFGTCAGLIMLAKHTTDGEQPLLQAMDITVRRNAFGRQPRSFEGPVELTLSPESAVGEALGGTAGDGASEREAAPSPGAALPAGAPSVAEIHGIFIRAPWVEEVGADVDIIARCGDHIVGVRQGNMMGVAFHPELGDDTRLHEYFLDMVRAAKV